MSSPKEILQAFQVEAKKLESAIDDALRNSQLSLSEIVPIYYQVLHVNSLTSILKQQSENSNEDLPINFKIEEVKKLISEKFDSNLHPSIMKQLSTSIAETTKKLSSEKKLEKSKDEIEEKARTYEKLRQTMSTKEFVEQYDKELSDD